LGTRRDPTADLGNASSGVLLTFSRVTLAGFAGVCTARVVVVMPRREAVRFDRTEEARAPSSGQWETAAIVGVFGGCQTRPRAINRYRFGRRVRLVCPLPRCTASLYREGRLRSRARNARAGDSREFRAEGRRSGWNGGTARGEIFAPRGPVRLSQVRSRFEVCGFSFARPGGRGFSGQG
jgi:hypothetical protein